MKRLRRCGAARACLAECAGGAPRPKSWALARHCLAHVCRPTRSMVAARHPVDDR
eukprot:CAMPEP_0206178190 /NCGR_PEP_ID=MMETSP1474-20131121/63495_1 /ASSEMBLY_ACC=CAM_ASM_001110 /TAXON_ID=97495 /ORGANISM="Imantonia sp., Strain RCC918" /LENGTH=54 /DNA_ID=CAMNT_0053590515 /DNA_START=52 /DNA_END=216 /DNA_ORIENTATION=-